MNARVMRTVWLALTVLAATLLLVACGPAPEPTATPAVAAPTQPPAEPTELPTAVEPTQPPAAEKLFPAEKPSAVRGKGIFAANCAVCHGAAGDGSGLQGAANFTNVELVRGEKPSEFFTAIRDGVAGTAMPAWGETLSEMEIWDVLYYERGFATSPDEIGQGEGLYTQNCVACHGAAGDGSGLPGAANFTDAVFMSDKTSQQLSSSITNGVAGSAMPAWGEELTQEQIWALVSYVWTFAYEPDLEIAAARPTPTSVPPTEAAPTQPAEPAPTKALVPTEAPGPTVAPDPARGQQIWQQKPCIGCHGAQAEGNIGPRLAGTVLEFDEVLFRVRTGKAPMPAFSEQEVSDQELQDIYAWLKSLAPPTSAPEPTSTGPTPAPSQALPPKEHLMAFWEHVNWVKVHSDFAKDASPTIQAVQERVNKAKTEAQGALSEADLAIADVPNAQAQATIREVKGFMNEILKHADAALGTQDLNAARAEAARMVEISRLDSWPRASLAVKQAGFTGSVRVRVRDQAGNPLSGALVTALTAPTPAGARTGSDGRVTIPDLAAVRVMQVKAYKDGLVYHEVNVTVPVGGRADADITLPGPPTGGQTPAVSNASINPASGPGNAKVTFRMTGTDPQGHANIAEDQVFALNPDLGLAYVLRSAGGDNWETSVTLPGLPAGTHTWYFFIVDHQCNTSNIVPQTYTVQ